MTRKDVETIIEASLGATPAPMVSEVVAFARKTLKFNFAATVTEPCYVKNVAPVVHESGKEVVTVIAYPLGGMTREAKLFQAKQAWADGADGMDFSMNLTAFKNGEHQRVLDEIKAMIELAEGRPTKMIYFAAALTEAEQLRAAELALRGGCGWLKTNPGFGYVTTTDQVRLIKREFGQALRVMTSGGVRTKDDAIAMIQAGADRIATSAAFQIMDGFAEAAR